MKRCDTYSTPASSSRNESNPGSYRSRKTRTVPDDAIKIAISYEATRVTVDVVPSMTVHDVKEIVRDIFNIGPDEGPSSAEIQDRKILCLIYAGSDLDNSWNITDLGIITGSTIKAVLKDDIKPSMQVYQSFNGETIFLYQKINTVKTTVAEFRGVVSRRSGLPVGSFRLVNRMEGGLEMFDIHTLDEYDIHPGDTVKLQTWDGWNDFLNSSILGFTSHVMSYLSSDEVVARYQMKVALYIAAHYGHIDLAGTLVRHGTRADEPVGEHPTRQWCKDAIKHVDSLKTPVHEAAEAGQLGVLRSFIHQNICNILAKDGKGLTPLNIALRTRQKACASFLLTKQWTKIGYTKKTSIPLTIYVKMKRWSDQAKEKVLMIHGQWKSSIKNPKRYMPSGALVDYGIHLDGFTKSKLTSKPTPLAKMEEEEEAKRKRILFDVREEDRRRRNTPSPSSYFKNLSVGINAKLQKTNKNAKPVSKANAEVNQEVTEHIEDLDVDVNDSPEPKRKFRPRSSSEGKIDSHIRLPPINKKMGQKMRAVSLSHQSLSTSNKMSGNQGIYVKTPGLGKASSSSHSIPDSKAAYPEQGEGATEPGEDQDERRRRTRSLKSTSLAKSQTDGHLTLPLSSVENSPRPFVRSGSEELMKGTLSLYEKYRGLKSRDYAIKCMSVASTFREKPWLQQVNQAMVISKKGVKKVVEKQPHMFSPRHQTSAVSMAQSGTT